ncbi:MAG: glycosyltransferase family 2 protein [Planctomycetota bacterium]|nr:glycosyltransferase family 2 protein [Planctomycetota bacterium]
MTTLEILAASGAAISAFMLAMTAANIRRYTRDRATGREANSLPRVTVCIPARNEEANIAPCVEGLLSGGYPALRVLVYDDQSTDRTPEIVRELAARDSRVSLVPMVEKTPEWNGKQHGCWRMAQFAACDDAPSDWLLFTDADVRFAPGALSRAIAEALARETDWLRVPACKGLGLISTFPRQETLSLAERLTVPMIFFILMSYLPMGRMRASLLPSASAGCGQFLLARRDAYDASGGHAGFKDSMHDGIKLPRAIRKAGFGTDLYDARDTVRVRMYRDWPTAWRGFAKNAFEGLGSIGLLIFVTIVHAIGHVLPWILAPLALAGVVGGGAEGRITLGLALLAIGLALFQRLALARAFGAGGDARECGGWVAVVLHPLGVLTMTLVQWHSWYLHITGQRAWKGRVQGQPAGVGGGAQGPRS